MAPPASSSSPIKSPAGKEKNPQSLLKVKSPKSLSTATLQSLLPKRRARARQDTPDEFDIPADDSGSDSGDHESDEDELSYLPARQVTKGKGRKTETPSKKAETGAKSTKSTKSPSITFGAATNAKVTKKASTVSTGKQPARSAKAKSTPLKTTTTITDLTDTPTDTLDRPPSASSNKENRTKPLTSSPLSTPPTNSSETADLDDSGIPLPNPIAKSKEIKTLAKKFKEVDDWSLEYEDASLENSSDRGKR